VKIQVMYRSLYSVDSNLTGGTINGDRSLKPSGIAMLSVMPLWGAVHEYPPGVLRVSRSWNSFDCCYEEREESHQGGLRQSLIIC